MVELTKAIKLLGNAIKMRMYYTVYGRIDGKVISERLSNDRKE